MVVTELVVNAASETQSIALEKGWNIVSFNVLPATSTPQTVLETICAEEKFIVLEDEEENTFEENGTADIEIIEETEGYKIRVTSDCNMLLSGQFVQLPLNIEVFEGSNLISFPYTEAVDAMQVIQPLIDAGILEKVQDEKGNAIEYWGNSIGWVNEIGDFNPGEGYVVQASGSGILTIAENYEKSAMLLSEKLETNYFQTQYEGNGLNHMNINIQGLNDGTFEFGDEIAAFDGDICVGAVKLIETNINKGVASIQASLSDDDETNGFTEGNSIEIRVWKTSDNSEETQTVEALEGDLNYEPHASVFVKFSTANLTEINELALMEMKMYPNPARDRVSLQFSKLPESGTQIILLDITGKQLLTQEVESDREILNVSTYAPGIYFVRTTMGSDSRVDKLIIN
jgi:hypothetical protein